VKLRRLLLVTVLVYSIAGLGLTFAPAEILASFGPPPSPADMWLAHLLGAALLGLAVPNWLQRYASTGGVLGRPLLLTNLVFLTASFFASVHAWRSLGGTVLPACTLAFGLLGSASTVRTFLPARPQGRNPGTGAA
jgi:hypothetical protein